MTEPSEDSREAKTEPEKKQPEKKQPEKKQPETVLLSAEELRAIAGGAGVTTNYPPQQTQTSTQIKPTP
jgi:hypothetical protein